MDEKIVGLLGLAEHFRVTNNIKKCIQCLQALLTIKSKACQCRTHLQLGQVYMGYTTNKDLAKYHLEQAWILSEGINGYDDVKFETATLLAQLYTKDQEHSSLAKPLLRKAVELSQHNIYWHSKLLFQIAQIHVSEKEYGLASDLLQIGHEAADSADASYLKTLFLLSRAMVLIIERKTNVITLLNQAEGIIETIQNVHLKEYLKVFLLILQVCHFLQLGHIKSVKMTLKQLQQSIQTIIATNWPSDEQIFGQNLTESFMWLPKEQMYVLVYLVTVSHSMMAGYMEKAQKYTEKALTQIEKLKSQENKPILALFQIILLEHIIMCRLVMGNRSLAIKEIAAAKDVCLSTPNKVLLKAHSSQLHCLLGLYAMSANFFTEAEAQFHICLAEATHKELKLFANLNLAIVYLRTQKANELKQLLDHIGNDNSQSFTNQAMLGSYYYVQGLNAFHKNGFQEAKRFLRESLKMANAEDLNRLTSCSLVLLSHVFLSIGNSKESMNMVTPAMQLASKIPDVHVQLWGSAILRDLHNMLGNSVAEKEAYDCYVQFSQNLLQDQYKCSTLPEHSLINWVSSDPPPPL